MNIREITEKIPQSSKAKKQATRSPSELLKNKTKKIG